MSVLRSLGDAAVRRFFRSATIDRVDDVADGVRLLHLAGDDLRDVDWTPGQKVQLRIEGFTARTFTPVAWDQAQGTMSFLAAMHGHGPGAEYVGAAQPGQPCQFLGPRSSIDLTTVSGPVLLVGDDTSVGLAAAARAVEGLTPLLVFETARPNQTRLLLETFDLGEATLVPVRPDEALPEAVLAALAGAAIRHVVLTGRAQSIRRVRQAMKADRVFSGRVTVRAYWDENRTGLD